MAGETIELLKNYEPSKMQWPAMHQQKIDGVPTRVIKQLGFARSYTRQGERLTSIPHIEQLCNVLLQEGESVMMELHIAGKSFKEISGLVRRHAACRDLVGWIFDADTRDDELMCAPWAIRMRSIALRLIDLAAKAGTPPDGLACRVLPGSKVNSAEEAEAAHEALMIANPDAEGSVLHSLQKPFQPGKRCWGTQRMKPVPTIDLRVVGFEEAISENGTPLKMVGRINAEFTRYVPTGFKGFDRAHTEVIGIGPGALNHSQRKELWALYKSGNYKPRIAEIRYMRDNSYDALRQPTFKQWRDDKELADVQGI
jgi:ATP-dependent DNA ligase